MMYSVGMLSAAHLMWVTGCPPHTLGDHPLKLPWLLSFVLQGVGYAKSVPWSSKIPARPRSDVVSAAAFRGSEKGQQMHRIKPIVS